MLSFVDPVLFLAHALEFESLDTLLSHEIGTSMGIKVTMRRKFSAKVLAVVKHQENGVYFSGREPSQVNVIGEYLKRNHMFRDFCDESQDPVFSQVS